MSAPSLRIQIGRQTIDAAAPEMAVAIEQRNEKQRLPGLDDALNPRIIDPAKFAALVRAVGADAAARLKGRPLFMDPVGLRIAASSPTRLDAFASRVRLTLGDTVGAATLASSDVPYDCALARERTVAARRRTEQATGQVDAMDAQSQPAAVPRQVRYMAALAWRENAAVAAGCSPNDEDAKTEAQIAAKAATDFQLLGGSME